MGLFSKDKDGTVTEEQVLGALKGVQDPDLRKDIVSLGFIRNLKVESGNVAFDLNLTTPACPVKDQMRDQAIALVRSVPGVQKVDVKMTAEVRQTPQLDKSSLKGVKNIVAVGSGKGGVGKSTMAVNIAAALASAGARVGLLDGDIYGPTTPIMLGLDLPPKSVGSRMIPQEAAGLKFISMGLLVKSEQPLIWRGPMAHKALQQCLFDVEWGELDYLMVDLAAHRRRHRLHAAGCRSANFDEDASDVSTDAGFHSRHHREHELLHLPALRFPRLHFWSRRRIPRGRATRHSIPWRSPARSRYSGAVRYRGPNRHCKTRRPERQNAPGHCGKSRRSNQHPQLRDACS